MKINHSHELIYSEFYSFFLTCVDVFHILTKMDFKISGTNKGKQSLIDDGYTYRVKLSIEDRRYNMEMYKAVMKTSADEYSLTGHS